MAAMEAANPHQQQHGNHQPYPSLPASPTLTNPDMILPDYGRNDSPDQDLDHRNNSPLMMWKNSHAAAAAVVAAGDMHQMLSGTSSIQSLDHPYGPTGPITPTTPIIYGNGTMLSDIGEVTEVESTPGKPSPARNKLLARRLDASPTRNSGSDAALRSSPTIGVNAMLQKKSKQSLLSQRTRRSSLDSNSTVTTQEQGGLFADFDDSVSVGDSVFQGDDEESLASSYVEGTSAREHSRLEVPGSENLDRLSTYSATSLSRRAEEILANAKRRLTTMEGNLNRARTSLYISSPAYGSDASTPSPPFQRASTAMYSRETGLPSPTSPGHSRMSSDIAIRNGLPYRVSAPRSQSAMGAAGGYRQPLSLSKSADQIRRDAKDENARPTYKISPPADLDQHHTVEYEAAPVDGPPSPSNSARLSQFLSPTFGGFPGENGRGLQRSASTAQMRDIKDQMKDLKGKISSLREQARSDSIKRRSLQSLRTPSPFTHSQIDQWYAEPRSNRSSGFTTESAPPGRNPWNGEEESVDGNGRAALDEINVDAVEESDEQDEQDEQDIDAQEGLGIRTRTPEHPAPIIAADGRCEVEDDRSDVVTENGDGEEDPEGDYQDAVDDDYQSESGDSLYHDTVQHPISHEDREDAFDYEHFFLHSAMGSMSRGRRGSTDSYTSEDSMETTRGPVQGHDSGGSLKSSARSRRNSTASVSTIETFATAEEGRSRKSIDARGETDISDAMFEEYPSHGRASAGIYRPESSTRHKGPPLSMDTMTDGSSYSFPSSGKMANMVRDSDKSTYSTIPEEGSDYHTSESFYRQSTSRRPMPGSAAASLHRPSVSSFDSAGTTRSFPLVNNRAKRPTSTGILTPGSSSPDHELRTISRTLLNEAASSLEQQQQESDSGSQPDRTRPFGHGVSMSLDMARGQGGLRNNPEAPLALQALMREDKYLVERLVASLGRCVLGLTESGRASTESRMYRRRIDAARRILEGIEAVDP